MVAKMSVAGGFRVRRSWECSSRANSRENRSTRSMLETKSLSTLCWKLDAPKWRWRWWWWLRQRLETWTMDTATLGREFVALRLEHLWEKNPRKSEVWDWISCSSRHLEKSSHGDHFGVGVKPRAMQFIKPVAVKFSRDHRQLPRLSSDCVCVCVCVCV